MHRPDVIATFQLAGADGCRHCTSYGEQVHEHWDEFKAAMNAVLDDEACHAGVIEATQAAFTGLEAMYRDLYPARRDPARSVTRINPEAGSHPIPQDQRELDAALLASKRAWEAFPYYEQRYGDRGRRFSDSDTCWLATLVDLEPDELQRQIDWIGRVLSSRGMPTVMLERTLRVLHEELAAAAPKNQARYDRLLGAADALAAERTSRLPDDACTELCRAFEEAVGSESSAAHPDAAALLTCAVADTANGSRNALPSIHSWMTDEGRFSRRWIDAANALVARARQVAKTT